MSVKKIATNQPEFFQFSDENLNKAKKIIKKYPEEKQASALMPLLFLVQKQKYILMHQLPFEINQKDPLH